MTTQEFYRTVLQRADLADEADAWDATQAVCSALGERLEEVGYDGIVSED